MTKIRPLVPIGMLLLLSVTLKAQTLDLSKLPEQTRREIQEKVDAANQPLSPQRINEWVELGKAVGVAIGATAKELNVEVNAFAVSPVGKFCLVIIAYKIFGQFFLRLLVCLGLLFIGLMVIRKAYETRFEYTYTLKPWLWGLFSTMVKEKRNLKNNYCLADAESALFTAGCVISGVGLIASCIALGNL